MTLRSIRLRLIGFNCTFSKNRLYRAFEKYVAIKKSEINEKVDDVTC